MPRLRKLSKKDAASHPFFPSMTIAHEVLEVSTPYVVKFKKKKYLLLSFPSLDPTTSIRDLVSKTLDAPFSPSYGKKNKTKIITDAHPKLFVKVAEAPIAFDAMNLRNDLMNEAYFSLYLSSFVGEEKISPALFLLLGATDTYLAFPYREEATPLTVFLSSSTSIPPGILQRLFPTLETLANIVKLCEPGDVNLTNLGLDGKIWDLELYTTNPDSNFPYASVASFLQHLINVNKKIGWAALGFMMKRLSSLAPDKASYITNAFLTFISLNNSESFQHLKSSS